jgi:hypothetical protein
MIKCPYHTDSDDIETSFAPLNDTRFEIAVLDHQNDRIYEVTLSTHTGSPQIWFARMSIVRGSGRYLRDCKLSDRLSSAVLRAYDRHLKIGKEPVVNDYIGEGRRIVDIRDGQYLTVYDEREDRAVYIGGGANIWHDQN